MLTESRQEDNHQETAVTVVETSGQREGKMERYDMRIANILSHACSCLYVTQ